MMNDKDLKRNASGYVDEPCYKAVTAPPRPGEIWIHSKSGAQMLVLANVNGICPTLRLVEVCGEGSVPVTGKTMMYVKPYMIGYCFDNLLTEYVKSVKGEEMTAVRNGMVKSMGLEATLSQQEREAMDESLKALEEENKRLKGKLLEEAKGAIALPDAMEREYVEAIKQLEQEINRLIVYKDMYMDLIGKLVSAKVGAVNE